MIKIQVNKIATLHGHKSGVYALSMGEQSDCFYSAGGDGMLVKWNLKNPENGLLIAKVDNTVYAINPIFMRNAMVVGQNYSGIHVIDIIRNKNVASINITDSAIFDIIALKNHMIIADGHGYLIRVDMDNMKILDRTRLSHKSIRTMAHNLNTTEIALGCSDNTIKVIDSNNLKIKYDIQAHNNSVFTLHYAPDYQYLLSGSRDAQLKCWDPADGYILKETIVAHLYAINSIAFRPDGRYFATCSMDKTIKIWNSHSLSLFKVIDKSRHAGHGTSVNKLIWTSYKNQLVSASDDQTISIWEINKLP